MTNFVSLHRSIWNISLLSEISFKHSQSITWKKNKNMANTGFPKVLPLSDFCHYWSCDATWWRLRKINSNFTPCPFIICHSAPWRMFGLCHITAPLSRNSEKAENEAEKLWDIRLYRPSLGLHMHPVNHPKTVHISIFVGTNSLIHGFAVYLKYIYRYPAEGEYTHLSTSQHFAIFTAQARIMKVLWISSSTLEKVALKTKAPWPKSRKNNRKIRSSF